MAKVDFRLDDVKLRANVAQLGPTINKYLTLTTDFGATEGVKEMKLKAPWIDRTTNARSGLWTKANHLGSGPIGFERHEITFGHAVSYGIWLEIKPEHRGGRPIVMKTVVATGKAIMDELRDLFRDLEYPDRPRPSVANAVRQPRQSRRDGRQRAEAKARAGRARSSGRTKRTRRT